jgi:hypothetical protein
VQDALPTLPDGSDCSGIPVHYDLGLTGHTDAVDFRLGAACDGDTLHTASVICKAVSTALLMFAAVWAVVRLVVGVIYPPILSVGTHVAGGDET